MPCYKRALPEKELINLMMDYVSLAEKKGCAKNYVSFTFEALKSRFAHDNRDLKTEISAKQDFQRKNRRMLSQLIKLIERILSEKEIAVAERLDHLIESGEKWKAWALIEQILPKYWREDHGFLRTITPVYVYRTLYYLNAPYEFARNPRYMIFMMGQHLEGLLACVLGIHTKPLGDLSFYLKRNQPSHLSDALLEFNKIYIRTKHMAGDPLLESRLDVRTFSTREAVFCLLITRGLSMKLMDMLKESGNPLREGWKPIDESWLTWDSTEPVSPGRGVIAQSEHPED